MTAQPRSLLGASQAFRPTPEWEAAADGAAARHGRATHGETVGLMRSPLVVATIAIWLLSFTVWTVQSIVLQIPQQLQIAARGLCCDSIGAAMCGAIYVVLTRLEERSLVVRLGVALVLDLVATALFMVLLYAAFHVFWPIVPPNPRWMTTHMDTTVAILWTFFAWCCVYFSMQFGEAVRAAELKALDAQNRMLRYQLDPHFLFNIHSALATLIHDGRNREAERTVLLLSSFLRSSLGKDPGSQVELAEELRAMRDYMAIEGTRFADRLRFVEAVDRRVERALTPNFLVQPLLENAIKHGLRGSTQVVTVELGAAAKGRQLMLWVRDDGAGGGPSAGAAQGVGLKNVGQRLQALYGARGVVTTEGCFPRGFKVTLTFPLAFA